MVPFILWALALSLRLMVQYSASVEKALEVLAKSRAREERERRENMERSCLGTPPAPRARAAPL